MEFPVQLLVRGLLALATFSGLVAVATRPAAAMSYELLDTELPGCGTACPKVIYASGTIVHNEHLRFADFVKERLDDTRLSLTLLIDSPGGFSAGGQALGFMARKLKMVVIVAKPDGSGRITRTGGLVPATCASACVFVLAGGAKRYYGTGSRIGVHRSHTGREVLDPISRQAINGKLNYDEVRSAHSRYYQAMGINAQLAELGDKTPSERMHWLTPAELGKFRLAGPLSGKR